MGEYELKPCPFCGAVAKGEYSEGEELDEEGQRRSTFSIHCSDYCDGSTSGWDQSGYDSGQFMLGWDSRAFEVKPHTFEWALIQMKAGKKVRRESWFNREWVVYLDGTKIRDMSFNDEDFLATDWQLYEGEG